MKWLPVRENEQLGSYRVVAIAQRRTLWAHRSGGKVHVGRVVKSLALHVLGDELTKERGKELFSAIAARSIVGSGPEH